MRTNSPGLSSIASAALVLAAVIAWPSEPLQLIMLDPGHFHAAQLHVTMLPGFSDEARVYAPLGPELAAHINRVSIYNTRAENPTHWKLHVYAVPDFLERMRSEPAGNVVVLSGRNDRKIDYIEASVRAGQNVLADKPWIIESKDLLRLEAVLNLADAKRLVAYDAMTQRFDIAYQLQQALVNDWSVMGQPSSVLMESTHSLFKGSTRPVYTGSNAQVQVRQNKEEQFLPEVDVIPTGATGRAAVRAALVARLEKLASKFQG